jgi:tRNA (uracil-5-)-methyltransferase
MNCQYFDECGGCTLGELTYYEQLDIKVQIQKKRFGCCGVAQFDIIKSKDGLFRNRVEFRIWKIFKEDKSFSLNYAMNSKNKIILPIISCSIVSDAISRLMPLLINELKSNDILNFKLFSCEFLSSTTNDTLVSLIYHKKLNDFWAKEIKKIEEKLNIKIIGRSRKQKIVSSKDYIEEKLLINNQNYLFHYKEGGFTQPNQEVNIQMIKWVINNSKHNNDLCELYCGGGNFTIPLSRYFNKVLATEISKTSIKSAKQNSKLNNIHNIKFARMSSQEFVEAKNNVRKFKRLQQEEIKLDDYNFSTIFIDPPRAGLDNTTRELVKEFNQIIYISCNPETFKRDLDELLLTHKIVKFALFDQFPFTSHLECGVIMIREENQLI